MIDSSAFGNTNSFLLIWAAVLGSVTILSWIMAAFPQWFSKLRPAAFPAIGSPIFAVLILFVVRGFEPIERPVAHWLFDRDSATALRFGLGLDPLAWIVGMSFFAALCGTSFRNRPSIRMVAAAAGAWIGLCWVASSKTVWTALLGVAIQGVSSVFPLFAADREENGVGDPTSADERWMASTTRSWIALACLVAGATGLVTSGVHLDFSPEQSWPRIEEGVVGVVAAALFFFGLVMLLTPIFFAKTIQDDRSTEELPSGEERFFSFDGALGWSAVIILYRLHGTLVGTQWPLVISIASTAVALLSFMTILFHRRRRNASVHWMATLPAMVGTILLLLPAEEAFFWLGGAIPVSAGLLLVLQASQSKVSRWISGVFMFGAYGLVGWSTSSGLVRFYSGFEERPVLQASVAVVWLLFCASGWRIVLRGEKNEKEASVISTSILAGFLFLLAFGPALSGRWSGGSIPGSPDWISGARHWPWLEGLVEGTVETNWIGFAASQTVWVIGVLLGAFVFRSADLFSLGEKEGRAREIITGLFGVHWIREYLLRGLEALGRIWVDRVSGPLWERVLPGAVEAVMKGFSKLGEWGEKAVDPITSSIYSSSVRAPAKFVRWMHGGNVRLYGWFAVIWVLLFSLYLTRS